MRHCTLKITKRRLTQNAVAQITHKGAALAINGNAASCELPANTSRLINKAMVTLMPLLTIATPVTSPQAEMPRLMLNISSAARLNSGWRHCAAIDRDMPELSSTASREPCRSLPPRCWPRASRHS